MNLAEIDRQQQIHLVDQVILHRRRRVFSLLLLFVAIGFLVFDVFAPVLFDDTSVPAGTLTLAVVTAQLTMICVWGALVHGSFVVRLPWSLLLLVISFYAFALGVRLSSLSSTPESQIVRQQFYIGFFWLMGFVVSFVPLKILAVISGWRVEFVDLPFKAGKSDSQYGTRQMMLGVTFLAVTMGLIRLAFVYQDINVWSLVSSVVYDLGGAVLALWAFCVVSLLINIPCIWISLAQQRRYLLFSLMGWGVYCLCMTALGLACLAWLASGLPGWRGSDFAWFFISHQLMGGLILVCCLVLRGMGYTLQRGDRLAMDLTPVSVVP